MERSTSTKAGLTVLSVKLVFQLFTNFSIEIENCPTNSVRPCFLIHFSYVTHDADDFIYLDLGVVGLLLFKCG